MCRRRGDLADKPQKRPNQQNKRPNQQRYGKIFRLSFGPKTFVIISDPAYAKQILQTNADKYSKGLLSEILDFVMGTGLIPADGEVWKARRRAVVPALHKKVRARARVWCCCWCSLRVRVCVCLLLFVAAPRFERRPFASALASVHSLAPRTSHALTHTHTH